MEEAAAVGRVLERRATVTTRVPFPRTYAFTEPKSENRRSQPRGAHHRAIKKAARALFNGDYTTAEGEARPPWIMHNDSLRVESARGKARYEEKKKSSLSRADSG